jgi:phosphoserine phosphatase
MAGPENEFVVTVIGRTIPVEVLRKVRGILQRHGLEIGREDGVAAAAAHDSPGSCCVALRVKGRIEDEAALRAEFHALSDATAVDVVVQRGSEYGRKRRLFCFDMDSTLIQGEVIDELAKMAGVADRVVAITASAMRGEIEFQESFRRRVALLAGLPATRVHELLERIPLMEGTERLFRELKARGAKTAILSGGFTFFGDYLKEKLDVDYVHANELDVDADGYVTGEVRGRIVDGARKAELLVEIAGLEGIPLEEVVAVGDGANDLPMLKLAGMGVAFHAKPVVRASADFSVTHVGLDGLLCLLG